jgi:hypothetical protein
MSKLENLKNLIHVSTELSGGAPDRIVINKSEASEMAYEIMGTQLYLSEPLTDKLFKIMMGSEYPKDMTLFGVPLLFE